MTSSVSGFPAQRIRRHEDSDARPETFALSVEVGSYRLCCLDVVFREANWMICPSPGIVKLSNRDTDHRHGHSWPLLHQPQEAPYPLFPAPRLQTRLGASKFDQRFGDIDEYLIQA
jgi:hypothetical protein